jgi:hypothetical protein
MGNNSDTLKKEGSSPDYVYDQKHYATKVYFYDKDFENSKEAEKACYAHTSVTKEVYRDHDKNGYYYWQ